MAINYKEAHGPPLLSKGYMLVPIKAGEKDPRTKGWLDIRSTPEELAKWIKSRYYGGLGVLGKFNPGIDIDVSDRVIAEKVTAWCMDNIGIAPVRIGNAPRVLIPCVAPNEGIGPDSSKKYECMLGNLHQVDIRAAGQQWVAYGIHPKTKNPYTWTGGELHSVYADFLPTLTGAKIQALFNYFESIVPKSWVEKSKGRDRHRPTGGLSAGGALEGATAFENYKPPLNIDADKMRSMLDVLDPDGQVIGCGWRTVGMALFHQFQGSDEGKELFIEWSSTSIAYDTKEIDHRWPSWAAGSYGGNPVTAATIIAMYNEVTKTSDDPTRRLKSKKLSDWERRFTLVELADGTEVHDGGVPIHKAHRKTLRAFSEHNRGYLHKSLTPEGDIKVEPMVNAWMASNNVRHYAGYTYQPGKDRYAPRQNSYGDDAKYVNTFFYPPHSAIDNPLDYIGPFLSFLANLFPEKIERDWFIEWLARLIQNPSIRSFVTPINITAVTGTGRGILFDLLRLIVGGHNTHDVSTDDMEGRFNGFLDKCVIAVVQEIKAATGSRKYQAWERMKSLLADTTANIQSKGQDSYTASIYANFLMFSNNIDALPLQDVNERRIYAMRGANRPITSDEIDIIIGWSKVSKNIAAVFTYLKGLPVNESHFKRAPVSETKIQMVSACLGASGADLADWLRNDAPKVFDADFAIEELEKYSDNADSEGMSKTALGRALSDRGYHSSQIRVDNKRIYVYYHPAQLAKTELKKHYTIRHPKSTF